MQVLESYKTNVAFSSMLKRYTLEEFYALPEPEDHSHYELIEGALYIVPPPKNEYDVIISNITESLTIYIISKDRPGKIFHPRASIYIDDVWGTYFEPNMIYVSNELHEKMGDRRTSADVVFECLSEITRTYDRTTKADTYLALGVKELWLIDSDRETVEVRNAAPQDGSLFWNKRLYAKGETAESEVLENWSMTIGEVFAK